MEFFTRFSRRPDKGFSPVGKSLTQQHFKDECDINYIIKHYAEPGYHTLGEINTPRVPLWGDFSHVPDIQTAHATFQAAEAAFAALPAEIRRRFDNNPVALLAFVSDKANHAEAVKLGLIDKAAPAEPAVGAEVSSVSEGVNSATIAEQA